MSKVFLFVPYDLKDDAKECGCFYDVSSKKWYCYDDNEEAIERFSIKYIDIKYDRRESAKANDCYWDPSLKKWYTYKSNSFN